MNLDNDDVEFLLNEKNKEIYQTIYDLVVKEYENILESYVFDEASTKSLGTCGVYLSSIIELFHTTNDLLNQGYLESAGCLAAALWERFITLRMILINPEENSQKHVDHAKVKSTPWTVREMVNKVIANEHIITPKKKKEIEADLYYLQYTYFCAIKHGNPFTISHLNRVEKSSDEKLLVLKPNDSFEDRDLKYYFLWLLMDMALDALLDFCKKYNTERKIKTLKELIRFTTETAKRFPLDVPKIILTSPEELGVEFWKVLEEIEKR